MGYVYSDFSIVLDGGITEFWCFVIALGAPGYVVSVAEGIDVENVYVSRSKKEVLEELSGMVSAKTVAGRDRRHEGRTEVNMCHGSKNRNDTTNQSM